MVIACREEFGPAIAHSPPHLRFSKQQYWMTLLQSLGSLVHASLSSQDTIWTLDGHHDGFSVSCVAHSPSSFTGYHLSHGFSNSRDLFVSDGHRDGPRVFVQTALVGSPRCCPARLRGGIKLEAYHQSRQPHSFSLFPLMFWDFGSLYQGVVASFWPAVAAVAFLQTLRRPWCQLLRQWPTQQYRRCGVRMCLQSRRSSRSICR